MSEIPNIQSQKQTVSELEEIVRLQEMRLKEVRRLFRDRAELGVAFDTIKKMAICAEIQTDHFLKDALLWGISKLAEAAAREAELVTD